MLDELGAANHRCTSLTAWAARVHGRPRAGGATRNGPSQAWLGRAPCAHAGSATNGRFGGRLLTSVRASASRSPRGVSRGCRCAACCLLWPPALPVVGHLDWCLPCLTFGFQAFFKCLTIHLAAAPAGSDTDLPTWLQWFTSLPEPLFDRGQLQRRRPGELTWRAALLVARIDGQSTAHLGSAAVSAARRHGLLSAWACWLADGLEFRWSLQAAAAFAETCAAVHGFLSLQRQRWRRLRLFQSWLC